MNVMRDLAKSCISITIVGIPIVIILLIMAVILGLGVAHDMLPDWYNGPFADWLGLGCGNFSFNLTAEDRQRLVEAGFDPSAVAYAEAGRRWCNSSFGANIDIGILLSIWQSESSGGKNMGSCDGVEASGWLGSSEGRAVSWLLDHWQKNNVRERNPIAAQYIYPDYSGYKGGCSAGEMGGGQFIPTTAKIVCQKGLSKSGDGDVKSCDFWSTKVTFHAMAWWLDAIDYRADLSDSAKIKELYGWNHDHDYRVMLVRNANEINSVVGGVGLIGSGSKASSLREGESAMGDLKLNIIHILSDLGLLPEVSGWLEAPLRDEDNLGITQDWMETTYTSWHPGVDYGCFVGVDVIAVAGGTIIESSPGSFMSRITGPNGFGNVVWIDHGGVYTLYGHLDEVEAYKGQVVEQGEVIGKCGSTGRSTGPHVHFGVADMHPDKFESYRDVNPGWANPHDYLGQCVVTPNND